RDILERTITPYIHDEWKFSRRLTLNLGLRYEWAGNPAEKRNNFYNVTNFASATNFVQIPHAFANNPTNKNFAPRVGFAFDPFADHKTSIRGGFGIFYQPIVPGDYISGFHNAFPWTQSQQNNPLYPAPYVGNVLTQL